MALATRKFIWVVTISRIPNKQAKNLPSHTKILASPASWGAVKSRIPSRYLSFSRTVFWSNPADPENTLPDPGVCFSDLLPIRTLCDACHKEFESH